MHGLQKEASVNNYLLSKEGDTVEDVIDGDVTPTPRTLALFGEEAKVSSFGDAPI